MSFLSKIFSKPKKDENDKTTSASTSNENKNIWICKKCGTQNQSSSLSCKDCGAYR